LLVWEFDERLGFGQRISGNLPDHRRGKNTRLSFPDLPHQPILSRLAGHEDLPLQEKLIAFSTEQGVLPLENGRNDGAFRHEHQRECPISTGRRRVR
jgi:hypothetical protein